MLTKDYLINQANYIKETYGEDTVATLFADDVLKYLAVPAWGIDSTTSFGTYSQPLIAEPIAKFSHMKVEDLKLVPKDEDDKGQWLK